MHKPLALTIGLRYSRTRKRQGLLSFVSAVSTLGVMLGVTILIVALAVMNGSIAVLRAEALKSVPHITVSGATLSESWPEVRERLARLAGVVGVAPYSSLEGVLSVRGETQFVQLRAIDPLLEGAIASNTSGRAEQLLVELAQRPNGIVLDARLAARLGRGSGTEVSLAALDRLLRRSNAEPLAFTVLGFADFGAYGGGDIALINRSTARSLAGDAFETQLRIRLDDVFEAGNAASSLATNRVNEGLTFQSWREAQAGLFGALAMEKVLTGFMLLTIVAVGAVNIVSTLVMAVAEKGPDIAILRTMGASRGTIMRIFIVQGGMSGIAGTGLGALFGVVIASYLGTLSLMLERLASFLLGGRSVVFVSHLQTKIISTEVLLVCAAALSISLLATLYPAYRASKIEPAEVLRYE